MSLLVLLLAVLISIPIFILIRKNKGSKSSKEFNTRYDWNLGFLGKPLKYLYLFVSLLLFFMSLFVVIDSSGLFINQRVLEGTVTNLRCSEEVTDFDSCLPIDLIYEVQYVVDGNEYIVTSSGSGVRVHTPSPLYEENVKLDDKVEVFVDSSDYDNAIVKKDSGSLILAVSLLAGLSINFFIHSIYLNRIIIVNAINKFIRYVSYPFKIWWKLIDEGRVSFGTVPNASFKEKLIFHLVTAFLAILFIWLVAIISSVF